jgi:hypothetical protein
VLAPLRAASSGGAHSPAVEVVKDLFEIAVVARSRAATGHVPGDVLAQRRPQLGVLSASVEAALRVIEATKQADCRPCGPSGHVVVVAGCITIYRMLS